MYLNHFTHDPQKKNSRLHPLPAVLAALALSLALLTGCSGTGTMYTPDSFADDEDDMEAAYTGATEAAAQAAESYTGAEIAEEEMLPLHKQQEGAEDTEEAASKHKHRHRRKLQADLEGTGSDLYTAQTVNSYYRFTLNDENFSLPCSFADLANAGWVLAEAGDETSGKAPLVIPSYSFEYADAVPAGNKGSSEKIRLCLANFTENDLVPASCTVCGIQVSKDSSAMLKTNFGIGVGDSLDSLTSVFGRDPSCYQQTQYNDGICTVRYHFSNGLNENETIPVLAEAEDKSLAELLLAETMEDGSTIRSLSLFYFRLPE